MTRTNTPNLPLPGFRWRGFTLQIFLITILPLSLILVAVVFISQNLHHQAMVQLVGDRNLRAVRAVADALSMQLDQKVYSIRIAAGFLENGTALNSANPSLNLIAAEFDGGVGVFTPQNEVSAFRGALADLTLLPGREPDFWAQIKSASTPLMTAHTMAEGKTMEWVGMQLADGRILAGGFSPEPDIRQTVINILSGDQARLLIVNQANTVVYYSGDLASLGPVLDHPGVQDALNGESGVNTVASHHGDLVSAFSYIPQAGWALILEENWEEIATPYLSITQAAPLILIPLLVLALMVLLFGARQIVQPLQTLAAKASRLSRGDFAAVQQPVGGIAEIRQLQSVLGATAADLESAQVALRSYIDAITDGVEKERRSLARELHDDTLQALIALNQRFQMALSAADNPEERVSIKALQEMTTLAIANLRRMVRGLRPIYLDDLGLTAALETLASENSQAGTVPVKFTANGELRRLTSDVELAIYRIAQEAVTNANKHSQASQIDLALVFEADSVTLTVHDDGKGFQVPAMPDQYARLGHFGLLGMYERAELIGASLYITSHPAGTTIQVVKSCDLSAAAG